MSVIDTVRIPPPETKRSWFAWLIWLATEDHCEWANRYVYWVKTPLGILASCALFALLCGLFVAPQAFVLLAVIAAVVMVGVAWPGIAVRGLRCRLVYTASRGREGKPAGAKLVVSNRWPWPVWGIAVDDPAFARAAGIDADAADAPVALARIDGWSRCVYRWSFVPPLRGVYPSHDVRIVTGFPFGLRRASRPVKVEQGLTVWPETFWLPPLSELPSRCDWGGEACESLIGSEGSRLGVRDYRQGDNLRDVHWAKSARVERLVVSEREASVVEDHRVIVDVDPARHAGAGGDSTLEWSLRIAASVCESVVGQRGRVELWLGKERFSAGVGTNSLEHLLDAVARFDPAKQASGQGVSPPSDRGSNTVISIGTDASEFLAGRTIVLHRDAFTGAGERAEGRSRQGIEIDSPSDVPGQVLKGWRRLKRSRRLVR